MTDHKIERDQKSIEYGKSINRLGRITSIIALFFMFLVPMGTAAIFGLEVNISESLGAAASLIAIFLPMAVVENISYYPVLGAGGMYLSSITGNILNMKLPAAISGMKIAQVEPGTDEGDVISVLSIGTSSVVTTIIVFTGLFLGKALLPILSSPILAPGFQNITPALMGAVAVPSLLQNKKLAVVPVILAIGAYLIIGSARFGMVQSYVLISVMALSVLAGYIMFKKEKGEKTNE
ncbi:MAG: hypothetical protein QMB54_06630 [Neofamilia sp.]